MISVPPASGIGDLILSNYSDLIKKYAAHIEWIGYLSSTGVYGDYQGNWVDESSICRLQSSSGVLRLEAENYGAMWLIAVETWQLL